VTRDRLKICGDVGFLGGRDASKMAAKPRKRIARVRRVSPMAWIPKKPARMTIAVLMSGGLAQARFTLGVRESLWRLAEGQIGIPDKKATKRC
jgi:hypothetical protein